jgi:hypothetical protein
MVALASSKEEVIDALKKDIYSESGVWDFSKVGYSIKYQAGNELTKRIQIQIYPVGYFKMCRKFNKTSNLSIVQVRLQKPIGLVKMLYEWKPPQSLHTCSATNVQW